MRHALRASPVPASRGLPIVQEGSPCPLLSAEGRCRIYGSRPFGCRTYFCASAEVDRGAQGRRVRDAVNDIGGRIAALSSEFAPRDPGPRSLVRALGKGSR